MAASSVKPAWRTCGQDTAEATRDEGAVWATVSSVARWTANQSSAARRVVAVIRGSQQLSFLEEHLPNIDTVLPCAQNRIRLGQKPFAIRALNQYFQR